MGQRTKRLLTYAAGAVILLFGLAVILFVLAIETYRAKSPSMEPALSPGDRFAVTRFWPEPGVGDIAVFHPPAGYERDDGQCGRRPPAGEMCSRPTPERASLTLVKRIVAVGGDEITVRDGRLIRNGRTERREVRACGAGGEGCTYEKTITVPAGHVFLLGDNRGASFDSRFFGPVPEDWIVGRYLLTYKQG